MDEILQWEFEAYEDVQLSGEYNMYSPHARAMTGLDKKTYINIMSNYVELKEKWGNDE